jgi:uncharacterized protein (TIGR03083 family)
MREQPESETLARDCVPLIGAEVAALLATVQNGGQSLWTSPSYCEGWAVSDIVAHLAGAFRGLDAATRDVLAGRQPEHLDPQSPETVRRNQEMAALPRPDVLAALDDAARSYTAYLDSLDDAALSTPVPFPFGPLPVVMVAGVLLSESVIHHWDIRQPRDPDARITPAAIPTLVSIFVPGLPLMCSGPKTDGTWQLDVDAPTGGPVTLRVQDGQVSSERGEAASPDVRVAIAGEALPLLVWGRLDVPAALAAGRMHIVAGDRARALALQQMFPGG